MVRVDLGDLRDVLRVVAVVRDGVVLLVDAKLRVGPRAELAVGHERGDPGQVGLVRDGQQVVHQRDVLLERLRDADRQLDAT